MARYIMAIDQGTTGSRAMIVNQEGQVVGSEYSEFPQIYPKPGWVEHDPEKIWDTTYKVMKQAMFISGVSPKDISGIGITNQRETTVLWDRSSLKPLYNAIVWQCRRSADICDSIKANGYEKLFRDKTGLVVDAYFSGTKIKWIMDNVPNVKDKADKGQVAFGTMDTWLIAKLTGGKIHVTDYTNASRTLLYDIHNKSWDNDLLKILGIPDSLLPDVKPSAGIVGYTDESIFGASVPIAGIAGDQQAALFGQACFSKGQAKNTYGTGCFMLLNVGQERIDPGKGLILTLACNEYGQPCYALEGSIFIGGAVIQWLRDGLGIIKTAKETQKIAESVENNGGVYLVPAFAGLGAPYWDMYARGGISGITRSTTHAHIVRAALEGIAFQVKDLISAFESATGQSFSVLKVDGGATSNNFLMQFQSDLLGISIDRSRYIESTGMGAAFLAGIAVELWTPGEEITKLRQSECMFEPKIDEDTKKKLYDGWIDAVNRVKTHS
ncbi:MAG: glycerol kinase GlpK [Candidatus Magnetomorum sp.]|nr:glycerol kinase GlpK [Candidatus Magnetomorum sp.]